MNYGTINFASSLFYYNLALQIASLKVEQWPPFITDLYK